MLGKLAGRALRGLSRCAGRGARLDVVLVVGCACVSGGWLCAGALGAETRVLQRSFGALVDPQGLGIDQASEDVYVTDTGNNRVEKFTASGEFILTYGANVNKTNLLDKNVCTEVEVGLGEECQQGTSGSAPGEFTTADFVAVDPMTGDLYVADTGDNLVSKFTSEGELVTAWGDNGTGGAANGQLNGSKTTEGSLGEIAGIAVGASGTLYVLNTNGHVFEFGPNSTFATEVALKAELPPVAVVGVAVNSAGDLFKDTSAGLIEEFGPAGNLIHFVNAEAGPLAGAFTVEPKGELYFAGLSDTLDHSAFNSEGHVIEPGGGTCAEFAGCPPSDSVPVGFVGTGIAAASGSGDTYLSNPQEGKIYQFGPLITVPTVITQAASEVRPRSMVLNGKVNPESIPIEECVFEYIEAAKYKPSAKDPYEGGGTAQCAAPTAGEIPVDNEEHAVRADVSGLTPGTTYQFRLRAANHEGSGFSEDATAATLPPPSVDSATVASLTATAAVLNVKIDPQGTPTRYHFEYDTRPYEVGEGAHGVRVPACNLGVLECEAKDPSIPAGMSEVSESAPISGLESSRYTYYWRVVASNESGTTTSVQHTFFYATSGGGLPDNRTYEMVTPDHKNGALIGDLPFVAGELPSIAADGSRVIAVAIQCFAGAGSCDATQHDSFGTPYEFARTSGGWVTTALAPSATQFTQSATWAYNATAGAVLFSMPTPPSGEDDFYVRDEERGLEHIGPNTPPEAGIKGPVGGPPSGLELAYAAGFSHFAWNALEPWAPFEVSPGEARVYEYAGAGQARPLQVGVSGGEGSESLISECGTVLGRDSQSAAPGMMSADGRVVFFTALTEGALACPAGTGENAGKKVLADTVYARVDGELPDAHTVAISDPSPSQCGAGGEPDEIACREAASNPAGAGFTGASEDGSKAFFLSTQQLTDQASEDAGEPTAADEGRCYRATAANGCNLYEYENLTAKDAATEGHLLDVSAGDTSGEGPRVLGVMALSPDGSHTYFVAKGVLSAVPNDRGLLAQNGANNLYTFERDAAYPTGRTVFVTALPHSDEFEWRNEPGSPANVTPDGRFLVFTSHADLTPDDTSASSAPQVFRYDAQTGQLNRVSIGSDGFDDDGNRSTATPCQGIFSCSEEARIVTARRSGRSDPSMSDDGSRVFFESPVGLAPHALDDVRIAGEPGEPVYPENVYEWEQEGVGSCPAVRPAGCVFLISDGRDVQVNNGGDELCTLSAVCLLGADTTGDNVFFATADQLVASDTNTELDYYDARVCEPQHGNPCIEPPPPPLQPCAGEECRGAPSATPPVPGAPSTTFNGLGNVAPSPKVETRAEKLAKALKACRRKRDTHKRRTCEASARRAYGVIKASRAKKASPVKSAGDKRRTK